MCIYTKNVNILQCSHYCCYGVVSLCRERDSNPHSHYWPRDFKSLVSTNSTIAATCGVSAVEGNKKNGSISAT